MKHYLQFSDLTAQEYAYLFKRAALIKQKFKAYEKHQPLADRTLAMIFEKASTRTRVSFEVGAAQLGATPLFLSPRDIQLGRGEPIADTARVLSRMVDGIMVRTYAHAEVVELAHCADVPVINGLTDLHHPCQILGDLLTINQHLGSYKGKKVAWIGDGNNMANSWLDAAAVLGFELALACPEGYEPDATCLARAQRSAKVTLTQDPKEAIAGAHAVNTDVWASMGHEEEQQERAEVRSYLKKELRKEARGHGRDLCPASGGIIRDGVLRFEGPAIDTATGRVNADPDLPF